ncbi:unnamed protein product [Periconia digitata]|uniref:Uncharacterized protein n=1 Tax=Periconia digitata TaxID=1303443 RepID=A0A9W4UR90_9PLEO|nr:unnamed protein product [Periconia digitata]
MKSNELILYKFLHVPATGREIFSTTLNSELQPQPRRRQSAPKMKTYADPALDHDPEEIINAYPYEEMYGDFFSGEFNPHTRNIFTGAIENRGHHSSSGEGAKKKSSFLGTRPLLVFCMEYIDDVNRGRCRCGQVYTLKSPGGCGGDHAKTAISEVFKKLARNQRVVWGDLRDQKIIPPLPPTEQEIHEQRRQEALQAFRPWEAMKALSKQEAQEAKTKKQQLQAAQQQARTKSKTAKTKLIESTAPVDPKLAALEAKRAGAKIKKGGQRGFTATSKFRAQNNNNL